MWGPWSSMPSRLDPDLPIDAHHCARSSSLLCFVLAVSNFKNVCPAYTAMHRNTRAPNQILSPRNAPTAEKESTAPRNIKAFMVRFIRPRLQSQIKAAKTSEQGSTERSIYSSFYI